MILTYQFYNIIQGFQVYTDIIDGFGGFACSFLEQLRDEYPKTAIWSFGTTEDRTWAPKGQVSRINIEIIHINKIRIF